MSQFFPYNSKLVDRSREFRKNATPAERVLWEKYLRRFPFRVLRQRPIANFIVDFYCAALKLVIEVDGDSHDSVLAQVYDAERTAVLEGFGLTVIRFTNDEVLGNFEGVCLQIEGMIPPSPPLERGGQEKSSKAPLSKGGWGDLHSQLMKEEIPPSPPLERAGQEVEGDSNSKAINSSQLQDNSKAPLAKGGWGDL